MYTFEKRAGMVLDQQDDPGFVWEDISRYWPEYLPEPDIGITKESGLRFTDGFNESKKFPTDTPEDTLASVMYFMKCGSQYMTSQDEIEKVAAHLDEWCLIHDVDVPEDFLDSLSADPIDDVYADDYGNLPITTPEQTFKTASFFMKNLDQWEPHEQILYGQNIKTAALLHDIEVELPFNGHYEVSETTSRTLEMRKEAMLQYRSNIVRDMGDDFDTSIFDSYIDTMDNLELDDPVKVAHTLNRLDKETGMDMGWGEHFPDPVTSAIVGLPSPFDKKAESEKWAGADFSKLRGVFEDEIVDQIESDPDSVIPTLPLAQRQLVEDTL